jgi:hypothetical protein
VSGSRTSVRNCCAYPSRKAAVVVTARVGWQSEQMIVVLGKSDDPRRITLARQYVTLHLHNRLTGRGPS